MDFQVTLRPSLARRDSWAGISSTDLVCPLCSANYGWVADNCAARQGCTVVVPYREEMTKRHLKLTGDLGRVIFMVWTAGNGYH